MEADTNKQMEMKEKNGKKSISGDGENFVAKTSSKGKQLSRPSWKILGTIPLVVERKTSTNGLENKKINYDA